MLSYQHIYHSGSLADVHKHLFLTESLDYLAKKDTKQISYYDTHAGRGVYDLRSKEAQKTAEYLHGIKWFNQHKIFPENHLYNKMLQEVYKLYDENHYPGSPLIAKLILPKLSHLTLMEMHPKEILYLKQNIKNALIVNKNCYEYLPPLLPPYYKKGLVLVDPSYEVKTEYKQVVNFIKQIWTKWQEAIIMLWYPILAANNHIAMLKEVKSITKNIFSSELNYPENKNFRMGGSGVLVITKEEKLIQQFIAIDNNIQQFLYL